MLPSPLKTVTRPPDTAPRRKGMPRVLSRVEEGVRRAPKPANARLSSRSRLQLRRTRELLPGV